MVLIGVFEDDLDQRDVGFVDVVDPVVLVRLLDSGEFVSAEGAHCID